MKKALFLAITIWLASTPGSLVFAQNLVPQLDISFNGSGMRALNNFQNFLPVDMASQADGKILVSGYGENNTSSDLDGFLYRINPDGSLDAGFGSGGYLLFDLDGATDAANAVLVLPDNKIMVLLESTFRTILLRLNPDGSYDTSFGNDGILFVPTDDYEQGLHLQMQADGKLLIISDQRVQTNINIGTVRRCLADGQLDTGYGNNGRVELAITPGINFSPNATTLQADGKLLITGTYGAGPSSGFPVFRLNTDGSFDTSFNSDGIAFKALGSSTTSAAAESIAVGNDGKIYVGGSAPAPNEVPLTMIALTPSGGTFGTFGTFGVAKIPFGTFATARKILVQPDGKLLVGGFVFASQTSTSLALARLNLNGTLDPDFGNQAGRFVTRINAAYDVQTVEDIEILPDGRLIAMAWLNETTNLGQPGNDATSYVLRYLTDILVKAEEPSPIFQNPEVFPNPILQNSASLRFFLEEAAAVSIHLYDASGLEIAALQPASALPAGLQEIQIDLPNDLSPGTYFISLRKGTAQKVLTITKV